MSKNFEWIFLDFDLLEKEKMVVKLLFMYYVVLNNDDYILMDFVIEIFECFFFMDIERVM